MRVFWIVPVIASILILGTLGSAQSASAQEVDPGFDLFESLSGTEFAGVPFERIPLGTFDFGFGPVSVGNADTIVERKMTANAPAETIDIEMLALQLRSSVPISIGSCPDPDIMDVVLAPSTGMMTIKFTDANGGMFDSTINLNFKLVNSTGDTCASFNNFPLNANDVPWSRTPDPNAVLIDGVNHFLAGFGDTSKDFFPTGAFEEDKPDQPTGKHRVRTATGIIEVGGTLLPLDTTALLLAGLQINAIWMIPAILGVAGAGIAIYKLKRK